MSAWRDHPRSTPDRWLRLRIGQRLTSGAFRHNLREARNMNIVCHNDMLHDKEGAIKKRCEQRDNGQPNRSHRNLATPIAWTLCILLLLFHFHDAYAGFVISIIDGDTTRNEDTQEKHRLYGIDAPELDQPYGKDSGFALIDAIKNQGGLWLQKIDTDRYGRSVVIFEYKDKSIGTTVQAAMIRAGWAWVYPQYCKRPECESWKRLERMAREAGRGLWADDDPIPPWVWRRSH